MSFFSVSLLNSQELLDCYCSQVFFPFFDRFFFVFFFVFSNLKKKLNESLGMYIVWIVLLQRKSSFGENKNSWLTKTSCFIVFHIPLTLISYVKGPRPSFTGYSRQKILVQTWKKNPVHQTRFLNLGIPRSSANR